MSKRNRSPSVKRRTPRVANEQGGGRITLPSPQAVRRAVDAFQRGDWTEAQRQCRLILSAEADNYDALTLSGIMAAQTQRTQEALELLSRAAAAYPNRADAHCNLGSVLQGLRRQEEALRSYDRALRIKPDHAHALNQRGNALRELKRYEEALASYDRALRIKPDYAEALNNRGVVLRDLKRLEEALTSYDRALRIKPDDAEVLNNRGVALHDLKRLEEALTSYDRALRIEPGDAETLNNRGVTLYDLKRPEEALACYDRALRTKPNDVHVLDNRGNALRDLKRPEEALTSYERALWIEPDDAEALNNRGNALCDLKRYEEAVSSYELALKIKPDYANAHWNLALCRLRLGDFARGWQEYEWRWKQEEWKKSKREFARPLWLGAESLVGKTILLHNEQGLGDTLQFCRYTRLVAALGAKVVLVVQPPLLPLLADLEGAAQVLAMGVELPGFDCHCPLLSLPLAFQTRLQAIPAGIPYIGSAPARVGAWQNKLGIKTKPRIGVVWSGSSGHKNDHNRSLALAEMLPLLADWAEYVSLQKDVRETDAGLLAARTDIRHFGGEIEDFADAAALVELVDVVVTADTSVAHLAGAMGKPVWILLPFDPDWRWLLDREDSPWYPTARLFRQPAIGDWANVIGRVREELAQKFGA